MTLYIRLVLQHHSINLVFCSAEQSKQKNGDAVERNTLITTACCFVKTRISNGSTSHTLRSLIDGYTV